MKKILHIIILNFIVNTNQNINGKEKELMKRDMTQKENVLSNAIKNI